MQEMWAQSLGLEVSLEEETGVSKELDMTWRLRTFGEYLQNG